MMENKTQVEITSKHINQLRTTKYIPIIPNLKEDVQFQYSLN